MSAHEGLGKLGGEEDSSWSLTKSTGEVRQGDVSRADGLREDGSKFHALMSLQKPEM